MGKTISDYFFSFADRNLPAKQVSDYVAYTQNDFYFNLALLKKNRINRLKVHFSRTNLQKIFISANLSGVDFKIDGWDINYLEKGFFQVLDCNDFEKKLLYLKDSLVIVNNNDVGHHAVTRHYADIFSMSDSTIFAVWDFDNHHWLELSTFLAAHSDLYIPTHHENLYLLTRYNWLTAGPVYAGSIQWSKKYITDHLPEMITAHRSDVPLGMHIPYSVFRFRIQTITTLNQHYPTVGFSNRTFHDRKIEDRLKEWYSFKSHWIVPVLNDVSIRIFDALITGGIPIVSESLRFLPPINEISRDHILFYGPYDIIDPQNLVTTANELFDHGGADKVVERHRYALNHHHGYNRIHQIIMYANEVFALDIRSR